ncbi:hypothetical protein [Ramlibacter sp. Leaf400]|uniref:hypothetical protein n=1 Tax=Ramlibacter sp. Leaf400 TaxID=1736365 RepID=UPI0006F4F3A2|nr:hypothetical protein [Ramlibacter sp. Leaf400]KQT12154.1 hypothetical protein ASG30_02290 [Ramlibacter sp. Leaf400]
MHTHDTDRSQRLRDAALARALRLRDEALDRGWRVLIAAARRLLLRTPRLRRRAAGPLRRA